MLPQIRNKIEFAEGAAAAAASEHAITLDSAKVCGIGRHTHAIESDAMMKGRTHSFVPFHRLFIAGRGRDAGENMKCARKRNEKQKAQAEERMKVRRECFFGCIIHVLCDIFNISATFVLSSSASSAAARAAAAFYRTIESVEYISCAGEREKTWKMCLASDSACSLGKSTFRSWRTSVLF